MILQHLDVVFFKFQIHIRSIPEQPILTNSYDDQSMFKIWTWWYQALHFKCNPSLSIKHTQARMSTASHSECSSILTTSKQVGLPNISYAWLAGNKPQAPERGEPRPSSQRDSQKGSVTVQRSERFKGSKEQKQKRQLMKIYGEADRDSTQKTNIQMSSEWDVTSTV